jgi:hypothetical protein
MSKPKFTGTQSNQGNSNGVNRGHEFTVQPMAESFGWQGQARYGRQGGRRRRSGDAIGHTSPGGSMRRITAPVCPAPGSAVTRNTSRGLAGAEDERI